jgi:DNA primase
VGIKFRCLRDHDHKASGCPKYSNISGAEAHLYQPPQGDSTALHAADDVICVTEGELDALVLTAQSYPAVGVPGAQAWKRLYRRVLADFRRVVVIGDGDEAGREFTAKVCADMPDTAMPVALPRDEDVSSLYVKGGPAWAGLVRAIAAVV